MEWVLLCLIGLLSGVQAQPQESMILQSILQKYDPRVRPVTNHRDQLNVTLMLWPLDLVERSGLNNNLFYIQALVCLGWTDQCIRWDPAQYDGLDRIQIQPYTGDKVPVIWVPDVVTWSGKYEEMDTVTSRAYVYSDGKVRWFQHRAVALPCTVETNAPFNKRVICNPTFGSWSYPERMLDLSVRTDRIKIGNRKTGSKWELTGFNATRSEMVYSTESSPFIEYKFTVEYTARE